MLNSFGISQICLNMALRVVVAYFEAMLIHTGPLVLFKSTSQCDGFMSHGGKHMRPLKYRLEKVGNINFTDWNELKCCELVGMAALTLGPPGF